MSGVNKELQKVPKGYKQTEVGVIPSDWDVCALGTQAPFIGAGKTNTNNSGEYVLHGSTGKIGTCKKAEYEGDAILIARVGANAGRLNLVTGQYGVSDNTIIVRLQKGLDINFFKYQLIRRNLNSLVFGSGQPLITGSQLKSLLVPMPLQAEQTAIANALSDVDALITSLEKLIAKKRAIKTAAMQQLLTGKKRLPPFDALNNKNGIPCCKQTELGEIPEDWDVTTIGEQTMWMSGGTPSRSTERYWQGSIPWISGSTLKSIEISTSDQFITPEAVLAGSKIAPIGSVLILVRGSALHNVIRAGIVVAAVAFNQDVKALIPSKYLDSRFLTFYFLAKESEFLKLVSSAGNSAGVLDTELIKNFKMHFPSVEEQVAIADILSEMGNEIDVLEQRLNKTQQIKQGMMQELLTGRTRLI